MKQIPQIQVKNMFFPKKQYFTNSKHIQSQIVYTIIKLSNIKLQTIINYQPSHSKMSSILNDLLFQVDYQGNLGPADIQTKPIEDYSSTFLKINHLSIINQSLATNYQIINKIHLGKVGVIVNFKSNKLKRTSHMHFTLLTDCNIKVIHSKARQLNMIKEISKRQKQISAQASIYIELGKIVMVISDLYKFKEAPTNGWIKIYNQMIYKNLNLFVKIAEKYLLVDNYPLLPEKNQEFLLHLGLCRTLNTTTLNTQISESQSQYNYQAVSLQKQRNQVKLIEQNIIEQNNLGSIGELYSKDEDWTNAKFLKQNILRLYSAQYQKMKGFLMANKMNNQKKKSIEDYIFNFCKINMLQSLGNGRPIAEGGKFSIYSYHASMNIILSYGAQQQKKLDKIQKSQIDRFLAVKKLKFQYQNDKKREQKVNHERNIVMKLKTSTSPYFPKYYGVQKSSLLHNMIIMEHIQGEELDSYVQSRKNSLSFWNKIYLLINIVHAMRVLKKHQIVHLDLKPINILVSKNLITKVIDFGQSYHKEVCGKDYTPGYTFPYVAPEVYRRFLKQMLKKDPENIVYSQKQDIFAFGIIMSEVLFESKIFEFNNIKLQQIYFKKLIYERYFLCVQRGEMYSYSFITSTITLLIQQCLNPDPQKRPCFQWIGILLKIILNLYISNN